MTSKLSERRQPKEISTLDEFSIGDPVWAKIGGHSFWPAVVCRPPGEKSFTRYERSPEVHVQFLDKPASRAWVRQRYLLKFEGRAAEDAPQAKGGKRWRVGCLQAERMLKQTARKRLDFISAQICEGDVVWAKTEGFPYWPGLACVPSGEKYFYHGGKPFEVHVQFFDKPPSRAWIPEILITKYRGLDQQHAPEDESQKEGWISACQEADEVLKLGVPERLNHIFSKRIRLGRPLTSSTCSLP